VNGMMTYNSDSSKRAVYAFSQENLKPIDVFKESKRSGVLTSVISESAPAFVLDNENTRDQGIEGGGIPLDFKSWLPYAAPAYHISPDPKDYILVPVIIMPSDLPNRNGVAFPLSELVKFNPEVGKQAYQTWKGKPTHWDHCNEDITQAYGVIIESTLRKLIGFNGGRLWKVLSFLSFDRSKHADTCQRILDGDVNSYSMGAWVSAYTCSYCGEEVGKCDHLHKNKPGEMYQLNNKLVFRNCQGIDGFETSGVDTPAYISALSDEVFSMA
jgi:hypothetical protein